MKVTLLALVLLIAACGSPNAPQARSSIQPSAATSPFSQPVTPGYSPAPSGTFSPAPSPHPSPIHVTPPAAGLLFAVVQNVVGSGCCGGEPTGVSADTVAIMGLDGHVKAKATFVPRKLPAIGSSAVILQSPAVVAGSGVYYLDGNGTVRVLRVNSTPQVVATFPQQGRQSYETWFAVSPTGSSIVAGVVTSDAVGSYFDLYTAPAGGAPTRTVNSAAVGPPEGTMVNLPLPIGWISAGPVVMSPRYITLQNAWFGGPLQVLAFGPGGVKGTSVGGADCRSASITPAGLIPCISGNEVVTVQDTTGKVIWTTHVAAFNAASLYLSPDGQSISNGQQASSDGGATWYMVVDTHSRGTVQLPRGFRIEGWLDNNTVIGAVTSPGSGNEGNLSWVSLEDAATVHDLGFKGDFVAPLA